MLQSGLLNLSKIMTTTTNLPNSTHTSLNRLEEKEMKGTQNLRKKFFFPFDIFPLDYIATQLYDHVGPGAHIVTPMPP